MVKIDIRSSVRSVAIVMLCAAAAGTVSAAGTQEAAQPAERMTIELQGGYKMEGQDTGWFQETVEERYNVEIVWNNVPKGGTQMETHLATGKFFDAGFVWKSPKELYYNALTRGIPEEMVVEHMPNYTKIFREQNPIAWRMNRNPEDPSEFLSLAGMNANNGLPRLLPAFRLHWATAVGVEVPGYAPENIMVLSEEKRVHFLNHDLTFAWFEEMLYAFRDGDPDGNGKADTIPWGANNRSRWSFGGLMGAFDIGAFAVGGGTRYNSLVDGELLAWAVAPGYRQFLKKMAAWYRDGILDNEFTNINNNQMGEKLCAGTLAAATVVADDAASSEGQLSSRPPDCITAEADLGMDGAATIVTKPLVGPDGSQGAVHYDTSGSGGLRVAGFIGAHVTDERLPRILEVLDYVHYSVDDPRVYVHRDFGQPGTHFEWKGEEYESQVTIYPQTEVGSAGRFQHNWNSGKYPSYFKYARPAAVVKYWDFMLSDDGGQAFSLYPYRWDLLEETQVGEMEIKHGTAVNTLEEEFYYKAITGQLDVDAEWDAYVQQWNDHGGAAIMAELAKAPIVAGFKTGDLRY